MSFSERRDYSDAVIHNETSEIPSVTVDYAKQLKLTDYISSLTKKAYPSVHPAVNLYLFNRLTADPSLSEEQLEKYLQFVNCLSVLEDKASAVENPLPTVGIELEFPATLLPREQRKIVSKLGIPNANAYNPSGQTHLWELQPKFTYSGIPQAVLLAESARLLTLREKGQLTNQISDSAITSLHLNFGIPSSADYELLKQNGGAYYPLVDGIVYGYTSSERLLKRKTRESVTLHKYAYKGTKSDLGSAGDMRMEIRPSHLKDKTTFRMLVDAQLLSAGLFSSTIPHPNFLQKQLGGIWSSYAGEITQLTKMFGLTPNLVDEDPYEVARILNATNISSRARNSFQTHAKKIKQLIALSEKP